MPRSQSQSIQSQSILWRQVWGLAAMLAAILVSFRAYELYQPGILQNLGFTGLVSSLGIVQGLLGTVVEPLVGGASDWVLRRFGSRLPQITVGVTLAGLIFVVMAFALQTQLLKGFHWLVPGLMLIWLMAMIAVRGPVVAMLRQFAPIDQLPHANAAIILVLGLVSAVNPLLDRLLQSVGASPTFVFGAIALLIGSLLLFTVTPRHTLAAFISPDEQPVSLHLLGLIFLVGVGASLEMALLMSVFPQFLALQLPTVEPFWLTSAILFVAAISANFLESITTQAGAARAMQLGLGAIVGVMALSFAASNSLSAAIAILLLGLATGLLFISVIPFAMSGIPMAHVGLSTGLYFGGSGLASALFALLKQAGAISPGSAVGWAIACFLGTAGCLNLCWRLQK